MRALGNDKGLPDSNAESRHSRSFALPVRSFRFIRRAPDITAAAWSPFARGTPLQYNWPLTTEFGPLTTNNNAKNRRRRLE